ncbi:MAG: cytochrome c-type biogenesis protein CcmH [Hyphomicrobiaceae bacterium]|nr:cytochrome c-type biogenesis protein CcmH [Hyphomicrobiaceae bacterium]
MKAIKYALFSLLLPVLMLTSFEVSAVEPSEMLKDPKLEARAREISINLRCLVCQNQSIDDSDADLAKDLRVLVRERLTKGDSNEQATDYIVDRYGEYVLLKPRMGMHTVILWFGPLLLLLLAGGYIYMNVSSLAPATKKSAKVAELSGEEQAKLDKLMGSD